MKTLITSGASLLVGLAIAWASETSDGENAAKAVRVTEPTDAGTNQ